jgi:hypothetical protein
LEEKMKKLIIALITCSLLALPLSAMAMDAITSDTMDGVSGQAGVTIGFGSATTTTIDFSKLSWGDPDGTGTATCANSAGWLIIDGVITISQVIAAGQSLTLDVGSTGAAVCTYSSIGVPASTTFIAVGLPTVTTSITVPNTLNIGLGNVAGTIRGTLGILNLKGLSVSTGTPSTLLIWAH